jgi:hypothetical protein
MGVPQGAFIIPRPGYYGQYYIFYESGEQVQIGTGMTTRPVNLSYSLIDMTLDGGLGGIVPGFKNIHALDDTLIYGRITGVKHANGRDWWIITHKSTSDQYIKILVTPDSILGPYYQSIGRTHVYEQFFQQAAFSPTGDKYVNQLTIDASMFYGNIIDLLDFDRCTGQFSNAREVIAPDSLLLALGDAFSPNGRWLYVNTNQNVYQYDTWSTNLNSTRTIVATWDTSVYPYNKFMFEQNGPDGKIYISNFVTENYLHIIDQPDSQGLSCNVIQNGIILPVINSFAMPNAPNYALGSLAGSPCDTLTTNLTSAPPKAEEGVGIAPNPFNSEISITLQNQNIKQATISIKNILGQTVYRQERKTPLSPGGGPGVRLDLSFLEQGIYLVEVVVDGERMVRKVVKE